MSDIAYSLSLSPHLPPFTNEQLRQALQVYCTEHGLSTPNKTPELPEDQPFLALRLLNLCIELMARIPSGVLELASRLGLANPENYTSILSVYTQQHPPLKALQNFAQPPLWLRQTLHANSPKNKVSIAHISPSRYRHSGDIEVTQLLDRAMPFEGLARIISKHVSEKALQLRNDANAIRVSEAQFPELNHLFNSLAKRLGLHPAPPLYVCYGPLNAYTSGIEAPVVVLHEACISQLSSSELAFVLGHELGHIQFEHMLYHTISRMGMAQMMILAPNTIFSRLGGASTDLKIKEWSRFAELSCDRAGLLACQDPDAAMRVMLRFAGAPAKYLDSIDIDTYLQQYGDHQKNTQNRFTDFLMGADRSHPWIIERIYQLREWITAGEYDSILENGEIESAFHNAQHPTTPYLQYLGLPPRYWHYLQGNITPTQWIIGDRSSERKQALTLLNQKNWMASEPDDAVIFPEDKVLFTLNAHALLSEQERHHIQYCHDRGAEVGLLVSNLAELEAEDLAEIQERLQDFVGTHSWPIFQPEAANLAQAWAQKSAKLIPPNIQAHQALERWVNTHQVDEADLKVQLNRALIKADQLLADGFAHLEQDLDAWFKPMSLEARRYEGAAQLQEKCQRIIQDAQRAFESALQLAAHVPQSIHLQSRHDEIPKPLIAAGAGAMAFGFAIFPGAPLWLMLSGVGVGLASIFSGRHILEQQRAELAEQQEQAVREHLQNVRQAASSYFQNLRTQILDGYRICQNTAWAQELAHP